MASFTFPRTDHNNFNFYSNYSKNAFLKRLMVLVIHTLELRTSRNLDSFQ